MQPSIICPPCISSSCQSLHVAWKARDSQDAHAEAIARAKDLEIWSQLCMFISIPFCCTGNCRLLYQTDHMLVIPWKSPQGWGTPEIKPCTSPRLETRRCCVDISFRGTKMALCPLTLARPCFIMPSASSKGSKHIETRTERLPSSVPS